MNKGVIVLKAKTKRIISTFLVFVIIIISVSTAFAADVTYPAGVTEKTAAESSEKTDILIARAVKTMQNKTLSQLVYPELFKDETLSNILVSVYSSLAESESTLSNLGIDISTANVAAGLTAYPSVSKSVAESSTWSSVKLENARWGVESKQGFATAVSAMLAPFNDVLYMILCSGKYKASVININGSDGYKNGVVSMLEALGCTYIASGDDFKAQAEQDKGTMVENIVKSILSMLDELLEAPSGKLTEMLPDFAVYVESGEFEKSVNAIMKPLTLHIGDYIQLFSGSQMFNVLMFIQNPQKYTMNFKENITTMLNDMSASSDIKFAEIDLEKLASCKGNTGAAYTVIFCWLIDTLKLNKDKMSEMLGDDEETAQLVSMIEPMLNKSTSEIFAFIVDLSTANEGKALDYKWTNKSFKTVSVEYTENLGKEKFRRVLKGIDSTINDFAVEFAGSESLKTTLSKTIYSSATITMLAKTLYGAFENEDISQVISMLGIPSKPYSVASYLDYGKFYSARQTLYYYTSWEKIESVNWGFADGDRKGFEAALAEILSPFEPVFEALLANGTIELFESIKISGSNGYNTAIIPLLEALGCPSKSILTYDDYIKGKGSDKIITAILDPLFDLADEIIKRPVYNLTKIAPNIIFFIKNGSMMQCFDNLLYPVTNMMNQLSVSLDSFMPEELSDLKTTDLISKIEEMVPTMTDEIKLEKPDLSSIAGMGQTETRQSKRTYNGEAVTFEYVKADKTAVLITILRYVIGIINNPDNGDLVGGMMSSGDDAGMFAQYSAGIGDEMAKMSTDETIEWLYKLFFRERAVKEEKADDDYSPTIIYVEQKDKTEVTKIIVPIVVVLLIIAIVLIIMRKRIKDYFVIRKERKNRSELKQEV